MAATSDRNDVPLKTPLPASSPGPITNTSPFIFSPEVLPYFSDCTNDRDRHACTVDRIQNHLQRHLRIPSSVLHEISTTVTFEIDADASHEEIAALVAQSQRRSAVFDIVTNPTNVSVVVK